jgi:ABC-type xylose transport system permease subunit
MTYETIIIYFSGLILGLLIGCFFGYWRGYLRGMGVAEKMTGELHK